MVSPVELTKLGVAARIQKLGWLKYIIVASFLLLILGATEIWRYHLYSQCTTNTKSAGMKGFDKLSDYLSGELKLSEKDLSGELLFLLQYYAVIKYENLNLTDEMKGKLLQSSIDDIAENICGSHYRYDVFHWISWINPISVSYAQMKIGGYSESDIRGIVIVSIFGCMGVFFFVSTGALLFSRNSKVVAFAMDSVKTLLGFFIGVAMTFMGVR